jgi:hypothetical protein
MWRCVGLVLTDVSEERIASIFRVEKFASEALALEDGCSLENKITGRGSQGACRQDKLSGGKPPVVK